MQRSRLDSHQRCPGCSRVPSFLATRPNRRGKEVSGATTSPAFRRIDHGRSGSGHPVNRRPSSTQDEDLKPSAPQAGVEPALTFRSTVNSRVHYRYAIGECSQRAPRGNRTHLSRLNRPPYSPEILETQKGENRKSLRSPLPGVFHPSSSRWSHLSESNRLACLQSRCSPRER